MRACTRSRISKEAQEPTGAECACASGSTGETACAVSCPAALRAGLAAPRAGPRPPSSRSPPLQQHRAQWRHTWPPPQPSSWRPKGLLGSSTARPPSSCRPTSLGLDAGPGPDADPRLGPDPGADADPMLGPDPGRDADPMLGPDPGPDPPEGAKISPGRGIIQAPMPPAPGLQAGHT
eukprot:364430-Chlamydomonas_euryale.AAC.1